MLSTAVRMLVLLEKKLIHRHQLMPISHLLHKLQDLRLFSIQIMVEGSINQEIRDVMIRGFSISQRTIVRLFVPCLSPKRRKQHQILIRAKIPVVRGNLSHLHRLLQSDSNVFRQHQCGLLHHRLRNVNTEKNNNVLHQHQGRRLLFDSE